MAIYFYGLLSTKNYLEAIYFFKNSLFTILTIIVFFVAFFHAKISLSEIFKEIGRTYAPFLLANAEAVAEGKEEWESEIDGKLWKQMPFVYQAKCLTWIREEFGKLDDEQKAKILQILEGSGCEVLIS